MLSKDQRLNLKKEFSWVASGSRIEDNLIKLFFRFGTNKSARVGIAVSSSIFKLAVERNRARRVVSKVFENLYLQLPANINIIVMPKKESLTADMTSLENQVSQVLKKKAII